MGEWFTALWLCCLGYRIFRRNWRCKAGEIDIVAMSATGVCFVEVKTRWRRLRRPRSDLVPFAQRRRIVRSAQIFLAQFSKETSDRIIDFTIVEIVVSPWPRFQMIRDAYRGEFK